MENIKSLEQFYLNKIWESILLGDDQTIKYYEDRLKELHRLCFIAKINMANIKRD